MNFKDELKEQLIKTYPYRIELHAHTSPVSTCADLAPEVVVEKYKELGYDGVVISNHFFTSLFTERHKITDKKEAIEFYLNDYNKAKAKGDELGIKVYLAAELRFSNENDNDYLAYGVKEEDFDFLYDSVATTLEEFYKQFSSPEHFLVQAHPFRNGQIIMPPEIVDAYEAMNLHPNHNSRVGVSVKTANEYGKIFTAGSDFHHDNQQGMVSIRCKELPETSAELVQILRNNDFLIDISGSIMIP